MLDDLLELEDALDRRLPPEKLQGPPPRELLTAATRWSEAAWRAAELAGPADLSPADLEWGRDLAGKPVFICGAHRSGTTLLRDLLDGHPELAVLPAEGTYLTSLLPKLAALPAADRIPTLGREWLRRLANPINQRPYWLLGRSGPAGSPYVEFARALLAWWPVLQREHGEMAPHVAVAVAWAWCTRGEAACARLWVEKTPTNERFLDWLWTAFPAAKMVHIVREPLAVFASQKRLQERAFGSFAAPWGVLRDLETSYRTALRESRRAPERFHLIRYEDLCAAPEAVVRRVAAFLDIEPLPVLLRPTVAGLPARNNSAFSSDGIEVAHGERDAALTSAEREIAAACVGPLAERLGYAPGTPAWWRRPLLRAKALAWSPRLRRITGRWRKRAPG